MKNLIRWLLGYAALRPCACGKRKKADRQECVGNPGVQVSPELLGYCNNDDREVRVRASMRCLVCQSVHELMAYMPRRYLAGVCRGKIPLEVIE